MRVIDIVKTVNKYLSGEQLTYSKLLPFLDEVIDDINSKLNSTYPSFTSLGIEGNPPLDVVYDCFPDRYIRSVVCIGAASKFYTMDEEGLVASEGYEYKYQENLFYMLRDWVDKVPIHYQSDSKGSARTPEDIYPANHLPYHFRIWS